MKLLYLFCFISFHTLQPKTADPVDRTVLLLKQANWTEFGKTFAKTIDLTLFGDNQIYSREQAEVIVSSFFQKNQPFTVKLIHRVDSNPDFKYAVATLTNKNGNYRTSFSLRNNNGTFQITELNIELVK